MGRMIIAILRLIKATFRPERLSAFVASGSRCRAAGTTLDGNFEDGLFRYAITPEGEALRIEIDLIGKSRFAPAGPGEYVAKELPATCRLRPPNDRSRYRFEFDWADMRSCTNRLQQP